MRKVIDVEIFYPDRSFIRRPDLQEVLDYVCDKMSVNKELVVGPWKMRIRDAADARHIFCAVALHVCEDINQHKVASFIGLKERSTIPSALKKVEGIPELRELRDQIILELWKRKFSG